MPALDHNDRQLIRISVQGYNTREDIDALVQALEQSIAKGYSKEADRDVVASQ